MSAAGWWGFCWHLLQERTDVQWMIRNSDEVVKRPATLMKPRNTRTTRNTADRQPVNGDIEMFFTASLDSRKGVMYFSSVMFFMYMRYEP